MDGQQLAVAVGVVVNHAPRPPGFKAHRIYQIPGAGNPPCADARR